MTKGEALLRAVIEQAIVDVQENLSRPILKDYEDAIVGSLKLDDYFIKDGQILEVQEYDWIDYADMSAEYTVWTEAIGVENE